MKQSIFSLLILMLPLWGNAQQSEYLYLYRLNTEQAKTFLLNEKGFIQQFIPDSPLDSLLYDPQNNQNKEIESLELIPGHYIGMYAKGEYKVSLWHQRTEIQPFVIPGGADQIFRSIKRYFIYRILFFLYFHLSECLNTPICAT